MPLKYFASGEVRAPSESVLVQRSGHIEDDVQIFCVGRNIDNGWNNQPVHHRSAGMVRTKRIHNEFVEVVPLPVEKVWRMEVSRIR